MVATTQREAWEDLQVKLGERQRTVLALILRSPCGLTLYEIKNKLGWPINSVSGRVTELRKKGLIQASHHTRTNPETGKAAIVWEPCNVDLVDSEKAFPVSN